MSDLPSNWATGEGAYDPEVRQMVRRYVDKNPPTETHGKIHEVDPAAVARFKQLMAQTKPSFRPQSPAEKLAQKLKQKRVEQPETAAEESDDMAGRQSEISDEKMLELYERAVAGEKLKELVKETNYKRTAGLSQRWAVMELPSVREARKAQTVTAAAKARQPEPQKRPYEPPAIIEERELPAATNGRQDVGHQANGNRAVQVADGFDRLISLGRLARELQAAGVQVALSGEINIKIKFNGGE